MEGSLVAYKVFTNGSVLQASEINENLMQQATSVFSNAAARTAAITSPVEGQMTYLEDINQYFTWNGSAWISPFGLTLLVTQSFTTATAVNLSNIFTSDYMRYRIMISAKPTSGSPALGMYFRENTTDVVGGYYGGLSEVNYLGTTTTQGANNANFMTLVRDLAGVGFGSVMSYDLYRTATDAIITGTGYNSNESAHFHAGYQKNGLTNITGITIAPDSSNMTGIIKVYGYKDVI
jgi:hypothetical protein